MQPWPDSSWSPAADATRSAARTSCEAWRPTGCSQPGDLVYHPMLGRWLYAREVEEVRALSSRGRDARQAGAAAGDGAVERRGDRRLHPRHARPPAAGRLSVLPARHLLLVARAEARGARSRTAGTGWRWRAWCCRSCSWCRRPRAARCSWARRSRRGGDMAVGQYVLDARRARDLSQRGRAARAGAQGRSERAATSCITRCSAAGCTRARSRS